MADDDRVKFKVGARTYTLLTDEELELGEIEQLEDAFNLPIEEIDYRRAKAVRYFVYFSMKRVNPKASFDDLGELKFEDLFPQEEEPKPKRPTKAKAKAE